MPSRETPTLQGAPPAVAARPRPLAATRLAAFVLFPLISAAAFASLRLLGGAVSPLQDAYHSIGIFTGNSSWAFEAGSPANTVFKVLATMAPVFTALGLAELVTGGVGKTAVHWAAMLRVLLGGRGVCVYGLNERSFRFALDAKAHGRVPIVFDDQPDEALAERCVWARVAVGGTQPGWLRGRLGATLPLPLNATSDIVSFLPGIGSQVDLAAMLTSWAPASLRNRPGPDGMGALSPRLYLLTAERGLTQLLEDRLALVAGRLAAPHGVRRSRPGRPRVQPRLQDSHVLAARQLLMDHPFDVLADAFGQPTIHLAIYGFGGLGRTIAKQAAQLYVTRLSLSGVKLKITAFDRLASEARAALLAEDPHIGHVIELDVQPMAVAPGGLTATQATQAAGATGHVFTLGDGQVSLAAALSLRRWLLEPEQDAAGAWMPAGPAPIFVSAAARTGLGGVLRPERSVKVGLFGFGAEEARFGANAILDDARERGGMAVHEAYVTHTGAEAHRADYAGRPGQAAWDSLPSALRESNFHVFDHLAVKARALGCRFVPRPQGRPGPAPDVAAALDGRKAEFSQLEHLRYRAEREASGWRRAGRRFDAARVHPDLTDWAKLDLPEQALDETQINAIPAIARGARRSFGRSFAVGVCGHRKAPQGTSRQALQDWLEATLGQLLSDHAQDSVVLLTCLAEGADSWAASAARKLGIPYVAPLPLPYELYREDFTPDSLRVLDDLLDGAEYAFELKLRHPASALTRQRSAGESRQAAPNPLRDEQYRQAGAYIFQRAHEMVYVWDGVTAHGPGGTADVAGWHTTGLPDGYRLPDLFFPPPDHPEGWMGRRFRP